MEIKEGQFVDLKNWGTGKIETVHRMSSGEIACVDVWVKPKTKLEALFAKNGLVLQRASKDELTWNGFKWVITAQAIKNRKEEERGRM